VLFVSQKISSLSGAVGMFITVIGISQLISSPFWGKLSDKTSKTVLMYSGLISALAAVFALTTLLVDNEILIFILIGSAFLLAGLAESGVRLGRKTYIVDAAPKDERPTYTAFSNSLVGILALATGVLGIAAETFGSESVIAVIGICGVLGAVLSRVMPEAEDMIK